MSGRNRTLRLGWRDLWPVWVAFEAPIAIGLVGLKLDRRIEPGHANHERYSMIYQVFRNIYENLKGDFDCAAALTP